MLEILALQVADDPDSETVDDAPNSGTSVLCCPMPTFM